MPKAHRIYLPKRINLVEDFSAILPDIFRKHADTFPDLVVLDFEQINFVAPVGIALISNLVRWLQLRGMVVDFHLGKNLNQAVAYLDDCGLFESYFHRSLRPFAKPRPTTFALCKVEEAQSYAALEIKFVPWLASTTGLATQSLYPVKTCLAELFNNIKDHTNSQSGCLFAQFFPALNEVRVSFGDGGIGIPNKVRDIEPWHTDEDAIIRSTQEGFTSRSSQQTRGLA
jgi:hypothetical protein